MKAMNVPKSSYPKTGKGARCDDVTSLDSWGELDEKMTAVTSQLNESPRAQISTPGNSTHTKKFADKMTDTPKRKSRSRSDLGGHSNGSPSDISNSPQALSSNRQNVKMLNQNKTSPSAGMGSYVDTKENLQVGSFEDVPVWSNTYIGSDAVVLNPLGLECMLPQNSSRHYYPAGSSDSHSLPESSVSRVSNSESIDKVNSSNKHGFLQKVKTGYLQKALQPNIDGAPGTSRPTTFGFKERKKYKDDLKHRSSESIYSSSEHAHSPVKSQATNEFTAEFEQNLLEQKEKVKTKVLSMWNNMKYGWTIKTKTQFRFDSPIYLLGKCYHIRKEEDVETDGHQPDCHRPTNPRLSYRMTEMEAFKRDFTSRLWFTYRRDFPMLPHSTFTTDCGWGCMLRSGQMMLAQAFSDHFLSRDWRLFNSQTKEQDLYHKQIIRWFGDCPSDQAPFSVHSLVQLGERTGKRPGDWYGPASVAHILKEAIVRAYEYQPILNDIAIYVSQDCTVYKQDILDVCSVRRRSSTRQASVESPTVPYVDGEPEWRRGVVILIPVRLGSDNLNPVYIPCLKSLLAQDCCLGIIGGKPRHSLYFIGWQEDKLIHLDPHYCQDVVDTKARDFPFTTYHCMSPRKMPFSKMDPSCTIGFYCKTKAEFNKFVEQTEEMVLEPKYKGMYPMFIFSEGSSGDLNLDGLSVTEDRLLRVRHINTSTKNGKSRSRTIESEEFVFL